MGGYWEVKTDILYRYVGLINAFYVKLGSYTMFFSSAFILSNCGGSGVGRLELVELFQRSVEHLFLGFGERKKAKP